jgi:hypothetical protein
VPTRPSLQRLDFWVFWHANVAAPGCARHTLDVPPDSRANIQGFDPTMHVVLWTGCHGSQGQLATSLAASVGDVLVDIRVTSSSFALELGDVTGTADRMLHTI